MKSLPVKFDLLILCLKIKINSAIINNDIGKDKTARLTPDAARLKLLVLQVFNRIFKRGVELFPDRIEAFIIHYITGYIGFQLYLNAIT